VSACSTAEANSSGTTSKNCGNVTQEQPPTYPVVGLLWQERGIELFGGAGRLDSGLKCVLQDPREEFGEHYVSLEPSKLRKVALAWKAQELRGFENLKSG